MLASLRIRNLALIDDLTWELAPGFNLLTGETGAGKSILIDAISLLLGERADRSLIRTGTETCTVEGEMRIGRPSRLEQINALLNEIGAEACEGTTLLLKRTLTTAGASRQFVNGSSVTLQNLRTLGDLLVDVHGPHDHQSLLVPEKQTELLDSYGQLHPLRAAFGKAYKEVRSLEAEQAAQAENLAALEEKKERLERESAEINGARLLPNEDVTLENEYRAASNAELLLTYASSVIGTLSESDDAVLNQLAQVQKALTAWKRIDTDLGPLEETNRRLITELQEVLDEVQTRADKMEADPARVRQMEDRLNLIHGLKRKYGTGALAGLEEVIARGQRTAAELAKLEGGDESGESLEKRLNAAQTELAKLSAELTKARKAIAGPLAQKITTELKVLGFRKAVFQVEFSPTQGPLGAERAEFIFAPNPGEAPKALRSIASSGEMARIMLALKTTLASVDETPILVFDEVDANVGGETATEVGRKLRGLGAGHQVLCITHLPQVAAQGQAHFAVEKKVEGERTTTVLQKLTEDGRQRELARMLGGQTEAALGLAKALLAAGKTDAWREGDWTVSP